MEREYAIATLINYFEFLHVGDRIWVSRNLDLLIKELRAINLNFKTAKVCHSTDKKDSFVDALKQSLLRNRIMLTDSEEQANMIFLKRVDKAHKALQEDSKLHKLSEYLNENSSKLTIENDPLYSNAKSIEELDKMAVSFRAPSAMNEASIVFFVQQYIPLFMEARNDISEALMETRYCRIAPSTKLIPFHDTISGMFFGGHFGYGANNPETFLRIAELIVRSAKLYEEGDGAIGDPIKHLREAMGTYLIVCKKDPKSFSLKYDTDNNFEHYKNQTFDVDTMIRKDVNYEVKDEYLVFGNIGERLSKDMIKTAMEITTSDIINSTEDADAPYQIDFTIGQRTRFAIFSDFKLHAAFILTKNDQISLIKPEGDDTIYLLYALNGDRIRGISLELGSENKRKSIEFHDLDTDSEYEIIAPKLKPLGSTLA